MRLSDWTEMAGIVSLASCRQVALGWCLRQRALGQQRLAWGTVTNHVRLFRGSQHLVPDPGYDWTS